ncbi:hypothetical protein NJ76_30375 [Rhodococcus sp. IITR03]|nr:hypothetical protein NJ76_30375 [Rhodococcus sp. IITR03]
MSDGNGERRSFRSGGSTPWSGRKNEREERADDSRGERAPRDRDERGRGTTAGRVATDPPDVVGRDEPSAAR